MLRKIFVFLGLITYILGIIIPLQPSIPRCTIVYTYDDSHTLKLTVDFPEIEDAGSTDAYEISLYNTQSKSTQYQIAQPGIFKKQYNLNKNAIYRVCFKFNNNRRGSDPVHIEYSAQIHYLTDMKDVQIPQNLLKDNDLKETYQLIKGMQHYIQSYKQGHQNKISSESKAYQVFLEKNDKIITISYIEIAAVLLIGLYQFYAIRRILIQKRYI